LTIMSFLLEVARATFDVLFLAAPFLLLGLLMAGLLHVLTPESLIARFMGRRGLRGVAWAALVGTPLPVCSCGVVPLTVELRRKGASEASSLSFLITTPESSADSILVTWGLLGPLMAVVRPIAAFATALLAGIAGLLLFDRGEPPPMDGEREACGCDDGGAPQTTTSGLTALRNVFSLRRAALADDGREDAQTAAATRTSRSSLWHDVVRPSLRYGFVELLDDLAFWLVLGLLIAGVLTAVLPADLGAWGLGAGLLPMVLVLAIAVPIYMCASASTPIAAALMAKGLSPGSALVFLLAGPATNAATVVPLARTFGRRFVTVYLGAVVAGSLGAGLALDALLAVSGLTVVPRLSAAELPLPGAVEWGSFAVLVALLVWRLVAGGLRQGLHDLKASCGLG
jgi:hypothetical protein